MRFAWFFAALAAILAPTIALAQAAPSPPYYATDPRAPMNPSASTPLQQQILENYRTQLQISQRALSQQGPPGLSREQLDINRQLNQYGAGPVGAAPGLPPGPMSAPTVPTTTPSPTTGLR